MKTYSEQIIDGINELWEARVKVFGCVVSLAMTNHLKEINDAFDVGDVFEFDIEHFKTSKDVNLMKLVEFYE